MAKAIAYAQHQRTGLNAYTTQGFLGIDNNASERALKRVAIGRKNFYELPSTLKAPREMNLAYSSGPACAPDTAVVAARVSHAALGTAEQTP